MHRRARATQGACPASAHRPPQQRRRQGARLMTAISVCALTRESRCPAQCGAAGAGATCCNGRWRFWTSIHLPSAGAVLSRAALAWFVWAESSGRMRGRRVAGVGKVRKAGDSSRFARSRLCARLGMRGVRWPCLLSFPNRYFLAEPGARAGPVKCGRFLRPF